MSNVNGKWKLQLVFYASFLFVYIEDNSIYYIEYLLNTYLWRCSKPVTLSHVLKILIFGVFWGDLKVGLFKNLYLSWLLILYDSMTCLVFLLWQVALLPSEKLSVDLSLNSSCVPLDMLGYLYSLLALVCLCLMRNPSQISTGGQYLPMLQSLFRFTLQRLFWRGHPLALSL